MQCVLPAGIEFYDSGIDLKDVSTCARSYPIVLTGNFPVLLYLLVFLMFYIYVFASFFLSKHYHNL